MNHEQVTATEPAEERTIPHFPRWRIILYSLGGAGNVLIGTLAGLATYFYVPPESGQANFPQFLSTNTILGFTMFGVIMFVANLLPTILGPFVASWSDRSRSKLGRRKMFMVVSFLPIAVLSYMIFTPPVPETSVINAWYLFGVMILLNVFRSLNSVSGAIPPEFGTTSKAMMQFSTFGSVGWILGYLLGSQLVFLIKDGFVNSGMTTLEAFRVTVLLLISFGCVLSIFQFAVIDEKKYGRGISSSINLGAALKIAFKNKLFVRYTLVNLVYAWGDAIFNTGLIYFVTINYQLPEYMMTAFGAALIGISLLLYPLVNFVSRKIGKKPVFMAALVIMSFCLILFGFPNLIPLDKLVVAWIIVGLASIYSAVTGILPGAIINEIVREDCVRTGIPNEAAYNAAGGLITAIPGNIPALVIPSLLLLGKSVQNHTGVTLVAIVSSACLLIAVFLIQIVYHEKQIIASLREHGYE